MDPKIIENDKSILDSNMTTKLTETLKEKYMDQDINLNQLFKEYYRDALNLNNIEYEEFLKYSVKKLPITFRINKMKY